MTDELNEIRARVDDIEHLHTRADLHLISEILKAAGYTCEIRDDKEWWSNGGVWSNQADAYGMLQFEDMLEVAKLCRRLIAMVERSYDDFEGALKDVEAGRISRLDVSTFASEIKKDSELTVIRARVDENASLNALGWTCDPNWPDHMLQWTHPILLPDNDEGVSSEAAWNIQLRADCRRLIALVEEREKSLKFVNDELSDVEVFVEKLKRELVEAREKTIEECLNAGKQLIAETKFHGKTTNYFFERFIADYMKAIRELKQPNQKETQ